MQFFFKLAVILIGAYLVFSFGLIFRLPFSLATLEEIWFTFESCFRCPEGLIVMIAASFSAITYLGFNVPKLFVLVSCFQIGFLPSVANLVWRTSSDKVELYCILVGNILLTGLFLVYCIDGQLEMITWSIKSDPFWGSVQVN